MKQPGRCVPSFETMVLYVWHRGVLHFANGSSNAESIVRSMLPPMARRGPDAEGLHLWPGVGFGFTGVWPLST